MEINKDEILKELKKKLDDFKSETHKENIGRVKEIGDGVVKLDGLSQVKMSEMIEFKKADKESVFGVVLNLTEENVGAIILGEYADIKEGDIVSATGRILEVPVGEEIVGRVINPLGQALDGRGEVKTKKFYPVEKIAPRVITRKRVSIPLQTGIKTIDSMIPIGRGQRELIIGDRGTGKTALALDTIINQKGQDVICIYVAIGQKKSKIARIVAELESRGAMEYTTIVLASASDPAPLLYIAPFAGCAIGEYFMDKGKDVLVVYDDLSKQAAAYRELSLLLRRPPGREAYPGDIFYLHSRLLERAACLNENYGNGSLTALPIIETQAGDISAYIPTNVISITDGQIFLEADLFYQGVRPALNTGLSVSRVGSDAQIKAMKQVAGKLKLEMAQYRELAAFAQFGSDLDEATKKQINRGARLVEILKQDQYVPLAVEKQVVIFYAAVNDLLDDVPVLKMKEFESGLLHYFDAHGKQVLKSIAKEKELNAELEKEIKKLVKDFKKGVDYIEK